MFMFTILVLVFLFHSHRYLLFVKPWKKEMLCFFCDRCQYKLVENFYRLQNPAHAGPEWPLSYLYVNEGLLNYLYGDTTSLATGPSSVLCVCILLVSITSGAEELLLRRLLKVTIILGNEYPESPFK